MKQNTEQWLQALVLVGGFFMLLGFVNWLDVVIK